MSNTFGLKPAALADIIRAHKITRGVHDEHNMKFIEDTLAGINYHGVRDMLHDGEYVSAATQHWPVSAEDGVGQH